MVYRCLLEISRPVVVKLHTGAFYPILKTRVEKFSQKLNVEVPEIILKRNLKSRWASLTMKESINFNMNLIKAPQDVIDNIAKYSNLRFVNVLFLY